MIFFYNLLKITLDYCYAKSVFLASSIWLVFSNFYPIEIQNSLRISLLARSACVKHAEVQMYTYIE